MIFTRIRYGKRPTTLYIPLSQFQYIPNSGYVSIYHNVNQHKHYIGEYRIKKIIGDIVIMRKSITQHQTI